MVYRDAHASEKSYRGNFYPIIFQLFSITLRFMAKIYKKCSIIHPIRCTGKLSNLYIVFVGCTRVGGRAPTPPGSPPPVQRSIRRGWWWFPICPGLTQEVETQNKTNQEDSHALTDCSFQCLQV